MNLTGQKPSQKPAKVKPDPAYLNDVRALPCAACGRPGPSEDHHCRDMPDHDERGLYQRLPAGARKSGDHDAIPLCGPDGCHRMFHMERAEFHALFGRDYLMIARTREVLAAR